MKERVVYYYHFYYDEEDGGAGKADEEEEDAQSEKQPATKGGSGKKGNDADVTRISFENENEETKVDIEGKGGSKSSSE